MCEGNSITLTSSSNIVSTPPAPLPSTYTFDTGSDGWIVSGTGGVAAWARYPSPSSISGDNYSSNNNSFFYFTNSRAYGSGNIETIFESPAFSTVGYTTLSLNFWQYYRDRDGSDFAYVEISTDNGASYSNVTTYTTNQGNRNPFNNNPTLNLSSWTGYNQVRIRFRYVANNDYYWGIDNVRLTGTASSSTTISWTSNPAGFTSNLANPPAVSPSVTTTYTVTYSDPSFPCPGSNSITVTVNPKPVMTSINSASVCNPGTVNIPLTSDIPSTYTWVAANNANVSGESTTNQNTNTLTNTLTLNAGVTTAQTVVYTVTPTAIATGCVGNPQTVNVVVNPTPSVNQPANQTLCSGTGTTAVNFTGSGVTPTSSISYNWTNDQPSIGLAASGSGNIASFPVLNNSAAPVTANIVVTPVANGCSGTPRTFTITVNPVQPAKVTPNYCPAPPNQEKIELTASGGPGPNTYLWSTGQTSQTIYVDMADVYSVTVTNAYGCASTAFSPIANEMVVNGNFEAGNTGFTSGYGYRDSWTFPAFPTNSAQSSLWAENYYGVGTDARYYHTNFWGKDHTSGSGNFMIVNGNLSAGTPIWQQTVIIQPNTNYYFSAWAMSLNSAGNDAVLQFEVNGVLVGSLARLNPGVSNNSNNGWTRFYSTPHWNSGSVSGPVTIRIRNVEPAAGGNDFGLDDISFGTLDPVPGTITPSVDGLVCEYGDLRLLANRTSQKPPFTYTWTGPNGFTSSLENPVIPNASTANNGTYNLTFTDGFNCAILYGSVDVVINEAPDCLITGDDMVCTNSTGNIYTGPAGMASYSWSITGDGTIVGPTNGQTVSVTAGPSCPDTYTLELTITDAVGCSSTCSLEVSSNDTNKPIWTSLAGALDVNVQCSDIAGLAAAQALEPAFSDLCSALMGVVKTSGVFVAGSCPNAGTITNTFLVTDICGNVVETPFVQTITIFDNTDPTWTTLPNALDRTVACNDPAGLTVAQALEPVASDNCATLITYTKTSGSFAAAGCGGSGTYTNTWIAKDPCGNTSDVFTQVITITDNSLPTWVTAAGALDVTIQCSDVAGLAAAQLLAPEATDECSALNNPVKTPGVYVPGLLCPQAGTYTNTWTVTDVCGNAVAAVYTQVITIVDNTKPVWTTPLTALNRYLECSDDAGIAAAQLLMPVATDNCDNTLTVIKTPGLLVPGIAPCIQAGSYTNTFIVTDDCGNVSDVFTQLIILED
ncbi:MAG: PKD-like domain-containing protein, partial [Draconibacterium sp.]|nr:PKD-like domain-containing protein [Draconibacterium sp.]